MAEIAHVYAEELTNQTHTGNLTYTTKFTVSGASFVGTAKYLLIVMAQVAGNNSGGRFKFRVQIDGVTPTGAEKILEPRSTDFYDPFAFGTVWTTPASPGDVTFQIAPEQNTGDTASADTIQLFAIRLDDDLTEGTDWFWNENTSNSAHATSGWDNRASITFTPGSAGDDWLVLAFGQVEINSISKNYLYRINQDSDTQVAPLFSKEGEDTEEQNVWGMNRVYNLTAASHTFTVQSQDDSASGAQHNHNRSGIFALNLAKFEKAVWDWTEAPYSHSATDTWEEIADLAVTPDTAGNWLVLGYASMDVVAETRSGFLRVQLAGTSVPTGFESHNYWAFDVTDEILLPLLTYLPSLAASSQDIDIDAKVATSTDSKFEDRSFVAFSMELAAAGGGDTIIDAPLKAFSVAALLPTVGAGAGITAPLKAFSVNALLPAVAAGAGITAPLKVFTLAALLPTVGAGAGIDAPLKNFAFTALLPSVNDSAEEDPGMAFGRRR